MKLINDVRNADVRQYTNIVIALFVKNIIDPIEESTILFPYTLVVLHLI